MIEGAVGMDIHQLRAERENLRRLLDGGLFGSAPAADEVAAVMDLWRSAEHHPVNTKIDGLSGIRLITSGWAGWLRCTNEGRRFIYLFLMPGDFVIPSMLSIQECSLMSLTPVRTVDASALLSQDALSSSPSLELIKGSGSRYRHLLLDHMTRLMMGSTRSSIALLLIEFHNRALRAGATVGSRFNLPIGQRTIAAAIGRSTVQVNKVLSQFQAEGLIRVGYDWVEMIEPEKLQALSGLAPVEDIPELQPRLLMTCA
jgi:CRP-like cAMP-binding protein